MTSNLNIKKENNPFQVKSFKTKERLSRRFLPNNPDKPLAIPPGSAIKKS